MEKSLKEKKQHEYRNLNVRIEVGQHGVQPIQGWHIHKVYSFISRWLAHLGPCMTMIWKHVDPLGFSCKFPRDTMIGGAIYDDLDAWSEEAFGLRATGLDRSSDRLV